jgi:hypothetical protein
VSVQDADVGTQTRAFAQSIGLLDGDGNLDGSWFEAPLAAISDILSDTTQRDATLELLDELLPETSGAPDGWREILEDGGFRVFLTTESSGGTLELGIAGTLTGPNGVRISLALPLVEAAGGGAAPDPIIGSEEGPIRIDLHVPVALSGPPVGLTAIKGALELQFEPTFDVDPVIELIGLRLGSAPASDRRLDANELGEDVVDLGIGLLEDALSQSGVPSELRDHLLPLFGLGGGASNIPTLPIGQLPTDPAAFRGWVRTVAEGAGLSEWLGHLAGLVGAPTTVTGSGTKQDPWRVALFQESHFSLDMTVAVADGRLWPGLQLRAGEDQHTDADGMHVAARAVLFGLPYQGIDDPVLAPDIEVLVRSPQPLVPTGGTFACGRVQGGGRWDGSSIAPVLEAFDVVIDGTTHGHVDLTQAEAVGGLGQALVEAALDAVVGPGPGQHLLALTGLKRPASAGTSWPHTLDLAGFLVDPLGAIGAYHRAVLQHGSETWRELHAELAALVGASGVSGTGTANDPWRFDLASSGIAAVSVDAWRVTEGSQESIRVGLAVGAQKLPFLTKAVAELVALNIPSSGGPTLEVGARFQARLAIDPLPASPEMGGFAIRAASVSASVDWTLGHSVSWDVRVSGVAVTINGAAQPAFNLRFPTAALDFSNPATTASGLGLSTAQLDEIVRGLVWRAARSWGGRDGQILATLAGFGRGAWDLPADLPLLGGSAGTLLTDPLGSFRPWLTELARAPGADGRVPILHHLRLAHAWLGDELPMAHGPFLDEVGLDIVGEGTQADPWRLRFDRDGSVEVGLWVGPAGPALPALPPLSGGDADVTASLAGRIRSSLAGLASVLDPMDDDRLASGLEALERFLAESDGVVPVVSQQPAGWATPAPVTATHAELPAHADVITAIRQHVAGIAGAPVTLLLSAPFGDRSTWAPLLGSTGLPGTTDPAAHFQLDAADIPPSGVDLTAVTTVADWYTADLGDGGDPVSEADQIQRILERLDTLVTGRAVVLVAHSTTGIAARRVAALLPSRVAGIVTIGTPHLGARPPWATEEAAGLALHTAAAVASELPAGAMRDAIQDAAVVVDNASGAAWTDAFFDPADTDLSVGAVPALALAGRVGAGLTNSVESAIRTLEPGARTTPDRVGVCLRAALGDEVRDVDLAIRATLEIGIGTIGLSDGTLDVREPSLTVRIELDGAGDWLVGGPGVQADGRPWPVRCRSVLLAVRLEDGSADLEVEVRGAAAGTPQVLGLADARTSEILDAVFARLSSNPVAADLLDDLQTLGLAVPAPSGGLALSSDAVTALRTTGLTWLRPRIQSALASGIAGLSTTTAASVGSLPVEISVESNPTRITVATTGDGIALGDRAKLTLGVDLGVPSGPVSYEAGISFDGFGLRLADGALSVTAGEWMDPLPLLPADAATFQDRMEGILPRLVFSAATTALVEVTLPEGIRLGPLDRLIAPRANGSSSNGSNGPLAPPPPASSLTPILQMLNSVLGNAPADALTLPGGFAIEVTDVAGGTRLQVRTTRSLGGIVDVGLGVDVGAGFAVTPAASLSVTIPDGTNPPFVVVDLTQSAAGTGLRLRPAAASEITLFPTFSGWASLMSGGAALLPRVLDEIDDATGPSPAKTAVLNVATEIGIYDAAGGFAAHGARFQELLNGNWNRTPVQQAALVGAARALFGQIPSLPGAVGGAGTELTWTLSVSGGASGGVSVSLDWADDLPLIMASVTDLSPSGAPILLGASLSVAPTGPAPFSLDLSVAVEEPLGLPIRPSLSLGADPTSASLELLPLATAGGDGPLGLTLLPSPALRADTDLGERIVRDLAFPLLLALADRTLGTGALWSGGPTLRQVLQSSGLLDGSGDVVLPPPPILEVLAGAATALSATISLGDLDLVLGNVGGGLGVGLAGELEVPIDDITLKLLFEPPSGWMPSPLPAPVRLVLLQDDGGWQFRPRLDAEGFGVGLAGTNGDLITSDLFRLGGANAFVFVGIAFHPWDASFDGAGVELDGVGLPLNQLSGGGGNGVVAGLLNSGDASQGEPGGAQPALGIDAWYLDDKFRIKFDGEDGPYWLSVQSSFGPLYIDQVGIGLLQQDGSTIGVDLLVDGGVSLAGLSVMVDDLTLGVPFRSLGKPGDWTIDLAGLAVSYNGAGVRIAGGLAKTETEQGVEYVGMLLVDVASFGLVAIGAWGALTDEQGDFTSLFVFAALFITISFPPYLEIRGIGLGFGYNRRIVVPEDVNTIPGFPLVAALDSGGNFLDNPMAALQAMRQQVPARRGSYWFAVGFHGTTFVVVHITAVLYVALDSGVEVGVLGVARMMLPTGQTALVSIELALKARYSSSEGLLSIQGQLTDNSWLLSRNCQLTGGFAFFMWFERGQFLLTIGGYHPSFQREPEYPEVPRVGLRWDLGPIHIKGESYFALTNSAVMAGIRIEASYTLGSWLRVWFKAWADFLLMWDPFHYDISIGIDLGAKVKFTINLLFGKVRITLSISRGAELRVLGPPLRGVVKVKLGPFKVTVAFGSANPDKEYLGWPAFRDKYILSEDPSARGTAVSPGRGLLQPEEKGADPPTGASDDPWRVNPEFALRTETRMPSSTWRGPRSNTSVTKVGVDDLDAAPMNAEALTADHVITIERSVAGVWRDIRNLGTAGLDWDPQDQTTIEVRLDRFPEAVWRLGKPPAASRNVMAIGGLDLIFDAIAVGQRTQEIPILELTDPLPRAPNPFTVRRGGQGTLRGRAVVAVDLIAAAAVTDRFQLAKAFLQRGGALNDAREAFGLPDGGLDELGLRSLEQRTSPPSVVPLSSGLTMEPVTFEAPPTFEVPVAATPEALEMPRLKTVAALPRTIGGAAPAALKTSVSNAAGVPRVLAPRVEATNARMTLGARLIRVPPVGVTPATRETQPVRITAARSTGATASRAGIRRLDRLERAIADGGVSVTAGEIHHWEIPSHERVWTLRLEGGSAARVLCLGRGSRLLLDHELVAAESRELRLPDGTRQLVTIGLGPPATPVEAGPGAVSRANAPGGASAVGWQADGTVYVATDSLLVARGSRVQLGAPTSVRPGRPAVASRALEDVRVLQTWLPAQAGTVMVVLERDGSGPISSPEIGVIDATLGAPLQERAGRRHVWLYPVTPGKRREIAVTLSVGEAWRPAGIVLLAGTPREVGARLHGSDLVRFVSDGPLSEGGACRMSLTSQLREDG